MGESRRAGYVLLTRGAVSTGEREEGVEPEQAALWGLIRAVRREHAERSWRLVDTDGSAESGAVLAKVDRMSMRFALEVRCPLLDTRLAKWAAGLPAGFVTGS